MGKDYLKIAGVSIPAWLIPVVAVAVLLALVLVLVLGIIPMNVNVSNAGTAVGNGMGSVVGTAVGSYKGVTEGWQKGLVEGKDAGLSATDVTIDVKSSIKELGRLEVLTASVSLKHSFNIGENKDYSYLAILMGNAVFTVDLDKSLFEDTETEILITLPQPEMELTIDESRSKKLADKQTPFLDGNAEDGYIAAMNARKEIMTNAEETITNYSTLLDQARSSAEKSVKNFAESVSIEKKEITVIFAEEVAQ